MTINALDAADIKAIAKTSWQQERRGKVRMLRFGKHVTL